MTFRQFALDYLDHREVSRDQAIAIVDRLIDHPAAAEMRDRWDEDTSGYPPVIATIITITLRQVAVEWIDENCPEAWFRPAFVRSSAQPAPAAAVKPPGRRLLDWRYPDKPYPCTPEMLAELDDNWIAETKCDGWRCLLHVQDDDRGKRELRAYTQTHMRLSRALHRDDDFEPELFETITNLGLPAGCVLDGEFMGRRVVDAVEHEHIWFFDVHFIDYQWIGDLELRVRKDILNKLLQSAKVKHPYRVGILQGVTGDLLAFYECQRENPVVEGIVAKRLNSTLIGDVTKVRENPDWLKCRFRV